MNVSENVKRFRMKKGVTQEWLAKYVGVTVPMITQIERGTKNPSLQVGALIAEALDCTVEEILYGDSAN